jgi:hypothetical protein
VVKGNPVPFVSVTEVGVPNMGVVKVGEVDKTTEPVPVEVVTPVPPLTTGKTPVTPDAGKPVQLLKLPEAGVPNTGAVSVGLVSVRPATVVVVFPKYKAVLPSVTAVAKLLSSWDRGIADVAVANVYGTVMLEPHS